MSNLRILLADDHAVVREGLKRLIATQSDLEVVGEASNGADAVTMAADLDPDVVVVDVSMPDLNGEQTTRLLRAERPARWVLALTVHENRNYLRLLLSAGATGYALKRSAADELIRAIRVVARGDCYLDPALAAGVVGGTGDGLSDRESAVLRLIAEGYSNKEIAARLGLSVKTVETYKTRSLEKLGFRSRVEIVRYALRQGWLATGGAAMVGEREAAMVGPPL